MVHRPKRTLSPLPPTVKSSRPPTAVEHFVFVSDDNNLTVVLKVSGRMHYLAHQRSMFMILCFDSCLIAMVYCFLCQRHFTSQRALEQHVENSPKHAVIFPSCSICHKVRVGGK